MVHQPLSRRPHAQALKAGQDCLETIRQRVMRGHKAKAAPVDAGRSKVRGRAGDRLGLPSCQQPTRARTRACTHVCRLRTCHGPLTGRTQRQGEHRVDRAVVAVRDGNRADVRVGLPLRRPRHHRARGDDLARLAMFACDVPKTARVHR